jgi:protein TonB
MKTFNVPKPPSPPAVRVAEAATRKIARIVKPGGGASPNRPAAASAKPPTPLSLPGVMSLSLADSDISKIAPVPGDESNGTGEAGAGKDSGTAYGPGEGPDGAPLYRADWYRRPTNAELAFYLPHDAPDTGWGEVACKTLPDYRVDNCRELAESPAGSGFSRAVREAAWQFRVLPPRIGGHQMIGTWVYIRITYTTEGATAR